MNLKHLSVCPARLFITGAAGLFFALSTLAQTTLTQPGLTALERQYRANPADTSRAVVLANALRSRAKWFQQNPQFSRDSSLAYYQRATTLLEKTSPQSEEALVGLYSESANYWFRFNEDDKSKQYCTEAWAIAETWRQKGNQNLAIFYDVRMQRARLELLQTLQTA